MYKKTIKFTDYNDNERTEDFFFNLTKAEALEMELSTSGGMAAKVTRINQAQDTPTLIALFKEIIDRSYGVKTPDGRGFTKSEALLEDFKATEAYSELFVELATNDKTAAEFVNGILPKDFRNQVAKEALAAEASKPVIE